MQCPKCQFDGPDGVDFCGNCGTKLECPCPNCHHPNPPSFKFCCNCGLSVGAPINQQSKNYSLIRRLLPESLSAKALAQKEKIEGERRLVTVMVCDMQGYTPLSERIGAEDAFDLMEQVYEILIQKVYDYEGTVNELTGDGIMAFFGAPVALEDAPQRAIRSALAVHREMARFNQVLKQKRAGISPLRMRIGIHTGPVVVGSLGNDLRVEFKAVGDTVNLTARMEGMSQPGTIYVSEETFKLTEGLFRFESLGKKMVKGLRKPVGIYRVIAPSTSRTRFDVSAERGLTLFVGRERELELLLDAFERVKEGRGQAFSIIAEAGVGKSRLLYEFRKASASEDVTFLEGRCLSYGRTSAYHPVIDILKSNFDIRDNDGQDEIKKKVEHGLVALKSDLSTTFPYILELFSIENPGAESLPTNPEVMKHRTLNALNQIALSGAVIRPLILAIEDLHWIDRSSEEYLKHLMTNIPATRILLIMTFRPEFALTWGARSYHGQINLNRLSNRECLAMVRHILRTKLLDARLEDLILQKTEGIPFFVEEFTKSLRDLNLFELKNDTCYLAGDIQELGIPATIQDVIMARVDSLPEKAREILKAGSVIDREFSYALIKRLSGLEERELLASLSILKGSELLYERGIFPHATYIFKHPLTREVVYNSVLTKKLRSLHEQVGKAIEEIYAGSLDEHYEVLAGHFVKSENYEKGAEYAEFAAKKANKAGAYLEAIEHAKRRVCCYENSGDAANVGRLIDARTTLAGYYLIMSDLINAKDAVLPIVESACQQDYQEWLPGIHTSLGLYHLWVEEDHTKGLHYLEGSLKVSEELMQRAWQWFTSYYLGTYLVWNCEFEKALACMENSLGISLAANDQQGIITAKSTIALFHALAGNLNRAYTMSKESLQMACGTDNPSANLVSIFCYGVSCYIRGLLDEAEITLRSGLEWHEKSPQNIYCQLNCSFLGDVYCELGRPAEARQFYERAIENLTASKLVPSWLSILRISNERAKVLAGQHDINLGELTQYYQANKYKIFKGFTARNIAEILWILGDQSNSGDQLISRVEEWLNRAIEEDLQNSARWHLGRDFGLYAKVYRQRADLSQTKDYLEKAINIFEACGAVEYREKAEQELASL